jgi:hypothetical protein
MASVSPKKTARQPWRENSDRPSTAGRRFPARRLKQSVDLGRIRHRGGDLGDGIEKITENFAASREISASRYPINLSGDLPGTAAKQKQTGDGQ